MSASRGGHHAPGGVHHHHAASDSIAASSAATTRRTIVYYHIPGDQDESQHPNAYPIHKTEVKLRDVREKFPLPGTYHFRFKYRIEKNVFVWLDFTNEDAVVPTYNNRIIAKALRISWRSNIDLVDGHKQIQQHEAHHELLPQPHGVGQRQQQNSNLLSNVPSVSLLHNTNSSPMIFPEATNSSSSSSSQRLISSDVAPPPPPPSSPAPPLQTHPLIGSTAATAAGVSPPPPPDDDDMLLSFH